jgi:hypothetical protein
MDPPTLPKEVVADALERDMIHAGVDPTSAARAREILCGLDLQEPIEVDLAELVLLDLLGAEPPNFVTSFHAAAPSLASVM